MKAANSLNGMKRFTIVIIQILAVSACGDSGEPAIETDTQVLQGPGIVITTPTSNFVLGQALDVGATPSTQTHNVTGFVRIEVNNGNNTPSVLVNQQVATVTPHAFSTDCPSSEPFLCFQFDVNVLLDKGEHTITATATDSNGKSYSKVVTGVVDYCRKGGFDPGVPALYQTNPNATELQNNRCHEIDGCSVYITETDALATAQTRNNPSSFNNSLRVSSTAFGSGEVPPASEYFVHGQKPTDTLPCNTHDVCYQTINGSTQEQCDNQMLTDMMAVCNQAYPGDCPSELNSLDCLEWKGQRETCEAFANSYFLGLTAVGSVAFDERQAEYK